MDATSRLDIPSISFPRIERLSSSSSSSSMEPRFVRNIFESLSFRKTRSTLEERGGERASFKNLAAHPRLSLSLYLP